MKIVRPILLSLVGLTAFMTTGCVKYGVPGPRQQVEQIQRRMAQNEICAACGYLNFLRSFPSNSPEEAAVRPELDALSQKLNCAANHPYAGRMESITNAGFCGKEAPVKVRLPNGMVVTAPAPGSGQGY